MKISIAIISSLYLGLQAVQARQPSCFWKSRLTGSTLYIQHPGGDATHIDGAIVHCSLAAPQPLRKGLKALPPVAECSTGTLATGVMLKEKYLKGKDLLTGMEPGSVECYLERTSQSQPACMWKTGTVIELIQNVNSETGLVNGVEVTCKAQGTSPHVKCAIVDAKAHPSLKVKQLEALTSDGAKGSADCMIVAA